MELILWRHAEAEEGLNDRARKLTVRGEKHAAQIGAWLAARLPATAEVLVSPARRTQQTAEGLGRSFRTVEALDVGAAPEAVLAAAGWPDAGGTVVIVGHQPTLGEVAAWLMSGRADAWSVKKGALWWFQFRPRGAGQTVLRAVLAPEHLD